MKASIKHFATATILAYQNPYQSVQYVAPSAFQEACKQLEKQQNPCYFGVKETPVLEPMKQAYLNAGHIFHTIDKMSSHGRAIDTALINPLTGRMMTGSSSGTAMNVRLGMNDIGIGSDGGGSVLAPAMALQLYGLIHPDFPVEAVVKKSTDGLAFSPCSGIITRDFSSLEQAVAVFDFKPVTQALSLAVSEAFPKKLQQELAQYHEVEVIRFPNIADNRDVLIEWLRKTMPKYDAVLSIEGPVDTAYYGDSILGSFSMENKKQQQKSGKGLLRVVNMLDLMGLTIPYEDLAKGLLVIGKETETNQILALAQSIQPHVPELVQRYFDKN